MCSTCNLAGACDDNHGAYSGRDSLWCGCWAQKVAACSHLLALPGCAPPPEHQDASQSVPIWQAKGQAGLMASTVQSLWSVGYPCFSNNGSHLSMHMYMFLWHSRISCMYDSCCRISSCYCRMPVLPSIATLLFRNMYTATIDKHTGNSTES